MFINKVAMYKLVFFWIFDVSNVLRRDQDTGLYIEDYNPSLNIFFMEWFIFTKCTAFSQVSISSLHLLATYCTASMTVE